MLIAAIVVAWLVVAVLLALLVGRGIALGQKLDARRWRTPAEPADLGLPDQPGRSAADGQ